jgi:hypothetical protein
MEYVLCISVSNSEFGQVNGHRGWVTKELKFSYQQRREKFVLSAGSIQAWGPLSLLRVHTGGRFTGLEIGD